MNETLIYCGIRGFGPPILRGKFSPWRTKANQIFDLEEGESRNTAVPISKELTVDDFQQSLNVHAANKGKYDPHSYGFMQKAFPRGRSASWFASLRL